MSAILQVNYKVNASAADYRKACSELADHFVDVPGMIWKVWLHNENEQEAGGILLFEDEAALSAFAQSELAAKVMAQPALSDFNIKSFAVMEDFTAITRGPLAIKA
jgi:hypothetical protein